MSAHLTTAFVAEEMQRRGYRVIAGPSLEVTGGAADSRLVQPGDLFCAFPGEETDGNLYVGDALRAGAVAAICARPPEGDWPGKTIVIAPDTTRAAGELAHAWRHTCNPRVVGITGTVGKTTAKEMTAATLADRFAVHRSPGNLNSREGLPLALMSLRRDHRVSVLELAMDSPGEIADLCRIAGPQVGAVLNVGLTHVSKLGSIEAIQREKLSLVRSLPPDGWAILNADDPRVLPVKPQLQCHVLTFGAHESADLRRGPVTGNGLLGTAFDVTYGDSTEHVMSPLPGEHTVPAVLTAMAAAIALGMTLRGAASAVYHAKVEGRARVLKSASGATIIDDRYNSSPASLTGALLMLRGLPGRRIAFLGRMAELGEHELEEHRKAGEIAASSCDVIFCSGQTCRALAEAARAAGHPDVRWFPSRDEAAAAAASLLREGDTVLVKASRGEAFEAVIPVLEGAR
jgi:UDP-N-acetylmuramoyl-tripeptide--D-alanyl-D-alanine ligase